MLLFRHKRNNFLTHQLQTIIKTQTRTLQTFLEFIDNLSKNIESKEVYVPNVENMYLRSTTTLCVENMFSLLNRKHGYISMQSFAEEYPQMMIESIKILLPSSIRGYIHPESYVEHYYPSAVTTNIPVDAARVIYKYLTAQLLNNRKLRQKVKEDIQKRDGSKFKQEKQELLGFCKNWKHVPQLKVRQISKMRPNTQPINGWMQRSSILDF